MAAILAIGVKPRSDRMDCVDLDFPSEASATVLSAVAVDIVDQEARPKGQNRSLMRTLILLRDIATDAA